MSPKKQARKSACNTAENKKRPRGFTDEERAAMKERARELTAEARRRASAAALLPKTWYGMPAYGSKIPANRV
jgi:hypothetical protein